MKIIFKWYDLWIGIFVDTRKEFLYVFPIPMLGLMIKYSRILNSFYELFGKRFTDRHYETGDVLDYGWTLKLFGKTFTRSAPPE